MKPSSKSRFLDYYFREAILAEDIRAKATKNGKFSPHFNLSSFLFAVAFE